MDWMQLINIVLSGGAITAWATVGLSFYKAKPEKDSLVIDNLSKVITEVRKNSEVYRKETEKYKIETSETIKNLEEKIHVLEIKDEIKDRAIAYGYRCKLPKENDTCPVVEFMDKAEEIVKRKAEEIAAKKG